MNVLFVFTKNAEDVPLKLRIFELLNAVIKKNVVHDVIAFIFTFEEDYDKRI